MFSKIGRSTTVVNILLVGLFFFNTVIFVVVSRIEVY